MMLIKIYKSWTNNTRKRKIIKNKLWKMMLIKKQFLHIKFINDWISHWTIYQSQLTYSTPVQAEGLKRLKMKWHIKLIKTKNNLITQMRIEKIELAKFLFVHKISKFDHSNCFCGRNKQTSEHVMMNCFLMSKKIKFDEQWMTRWKIIIIWWLFSKWWKRWQNDLLKWICCQCFRWPKINCIEKIWWWIDLIMKKFDDLKFKIL